MSPQPTPINEREAGLDDPSLRSDVRLVNYKVDQLDKKFDALMSNIQNNYASKTELNGVRDEVKSVRDQIGWAIKIVIGAVIISLVGLVLVKGGVTHP